MKKFRLNGLVLFAPANFGMIMATGIVSLAAYFLSMHAIAYTLFYLNNLLYVVLCILIIARAFYYPKLLMKDMFSHSGGSAFFTLVAGTNVLGAQHLVMMSNHKTGIVLWCLGLALWAVITYSIFTAMFIKEQKPSLDKGISGAWLLAVVATQSIAMLCILLSDYTELTNSVLLNFMALSMWLWAGMLYMVLMPLIFYRYTFFTLSPSDLAPPYWINMGAMATSTLVGSLLVQNSQRISYLSALEPFLKGFTLFYWSTATLWIPMLVVLAVWRHFYKRLSIKYDPLYWGAVFPLGMYSAATYSIAKVINLEFLLGMPKVLFFIALPLWLLTFLGLLGQVRRNIHPYS